MKNEDQEKQKKECTPDSTQLSDWLSYCQILIDDIRFAKQQQWRLTYYTLLLLGAVVALYEIRASEFLWKIPLFLAALGLAIFGTYFLCKFQKDLRRYRTNISKIRKEKFPPDLREIATYPPAEEDPAYYTDFLKLLIGVIWVGVFFVSWVIKFWDLLFCK